jgi:heme exporter protein D
VNGALKSVGIVLVLSLIAPPAKDRRRALAEVDSTRAEDGRERQADDQLAE